MPEHPLAVCLTRGEALRAAAGGLAALGLGGVPGLACNRERRASALPTESTGSRTPYFLDGEELARMRANLDDPEKPWVERAYRETVEVAVRGLRAQPRAPDPSGDYREKEMWFAEIYEPGLRQGHFTLSLALAHALDGEERFAERAKEFMLEWATIYTWDPEKGGPRVGHMIAEPVGFMVKAFLAYDLLRERFSTSERLAFESWAALFVSRGMRQADSARDRPWAPSAAVGNSATWARCLAVTAAAAQGGGALERALDWNWSHRTAGEASGDSSEQHGPLDYGWDWLIENSMHTNGKMIEEDVRRSVDYGLYTWQPLHIIADVDHHAGGRSLYPFETDSGKSLHRVIDYYSQYLTGERGAPYATPSDQDADGSRVFSTAVETYRAVTEKFRNAYPDSAVLATVVESGGPNQRGQNHDPHIVGYGALLGELAEA